MSDLHLASGRDGAPVPKGTVSLCFTWEASERLKGEGASPLAWEDLIAAEDAAPLMTRTLGLADSWHHDASGDVTEFDGYSLGRLYRWLLWVETLHPAYKFLTALARAVEIHRPDIVHCEDSVPRLYRDVLARAADPLGFRVAAASSGAISGDSQAWVAPRAALPLSKRAAGRALNAVAFFADKRRPEWLISYYHSLESVASAARRDGARISFADFPPFRRLPRLLGKAAVWLEPGLPPRPSAEDAAALDANAARWHRLKSSEDYASRFEWKKTSLLPVLEPILDDFVRRQARDWAWSCRQLDRRWTKTPPALVLLPFPGPPYQMALQAAARRHGTPVAVLLHGLPFSYSFPFEQPQDGNLIAWGPEQERLYAESSTRTACRVESVGNPHFDRYAGRRRPRTGPIRRVLLLTHPIARSTPLSSELDPARYIIRAAEVLSKFPELRATVRPHPSESVDYYRSLIGSVLPGAEIVNGGHVDEILDASDLVVGSFSTVLLEGMLLGLPVAALNFSRDEFPPPFDGNWGVPLLRTAGDLERFLNRARRDPEAFRLSTCARHDEVIARFAGRVDGTAAARTVRALERLAGRAPRAA